MAHSAVLLAGGKSRRMGRDKAALLVDGLPLWRRQLDILRATGSAEVIVSGPLDGPFAVGDARVIPDRVIDRGPLGGIATVLAGCSTDSLLVLAVDLPHMSADFLRKLVERSEDAGRGVVPVRRNGYFESLAAVYPRRALGIAERRLAEGELKMGGFIAELETLGHMERHPIDPAEESLFVNWNAPADIP